jgi:hypothetical protein
LQKDQSLFSFLRGGTNADHQLKKDTGNFCKKVATYLGLNSTDVYLIKNVLQRNSIKNSPDYNRGWNRNDFDLHVNRERKKWLLEGLVKQAQKQGLVLTKDDEVLLEKIKKSAVLLEGYDDIDRGLSEFFNSCTRKVFTLRGSFL